MNSRLTQRFVTRFGPLPNDVKEVARKNYRLWRSNPTHPSLHYKRVHPKEAIFSVRVGMGHRAVGFLDGDTMTWFWIGPHDEHEQLLRQLG